MSAKTVFEAWVRLNERSRNWHNLLCEAGLTLPTSNEDDFLGALCRPVRVDRTVPGFEDFDQMGERGLYPGDPAQSLLYHAFASPNVSNYHEQRLEDFPTVDEISALENLIYSLAKLSFEDLMDRAAALSKCREPEVGVVVFAYEYHCAPQTVHRKHADLCFSRTGVARVGTDESYYSPPDRGWFTFASDDAANTIRVIPARYAAFFAVRLKGDADRFGPKYFREADVEEPGDCNRRFWVPLHKLFSGSDCIHGCETLAVTYAAQHVNEKIRRMHLELAKRGMPAHVGKELNSYPFFFSSSIADLEIRDSSALVVPFAQPLVKPAELDGSYVTFTLPPDPSLLLSTFRIRPDDNLHYPCPKWVNCRTKVVDGKTVNMNDNPELVALVHQGGYSALHYVDFTGDGFIGVSVDGCEGLKNMPAISAYSIIAQPDFLPFVAQSDLYDWWRELCPEELKKYAWGDGPDPTPLSQSRVSANFATHRGVFDETDDTVAAVVVSPRCHVGPVHQVDPSLNGGITNSCLPDDASGDFAPGWDIAISKTDRLEHLSAYGLSSPFPEDARLCAGFGASWPAAAPDITNWFPSDTYPVVVPLGNQAAGWDETMLPVTPFLSGTFAEYPNAVYSDWVQTAMRGKLDLVRTRSVTLKTYTSHLLAMARVFKVIGAQTDDDRARYSIVYFSKRRKEDPLVNQAIKSAHATKFTADNAYEVHYFIETDRSIHPHDFRRLTLKTNETFRLYAHPEAVLVPDDDGNWVERT